MADYGLLKGLAEGLNQGFKSYQSTKKNAEEMALKKRTESFNELTKGADYYEKTGEKLPNELYSPEVQEYLTKKDMQQPSGLLARPSSGLLPIPDKDVEPTNDEKATYGLDTLPPKKQTQISLEIAKLNSAGRDKGVEYRYNKFTKQYEPREIPLIGRAKTEFETKQTEKQLDIAKKEKDLERGGKTLPASVAETFGFAKSADKALEDANTLIGNNKDIVGPGQGVLTGLLSQGEIGDSGKRGKVLNADLKAKAQIIGKYLEGGKLTDSDIARYQSMLPTLRDSPQAASEKINILKRLIANKQAAEKGSLGESGYDVSKVTTSVPPNLPGSLMKNSLPKVGEVKDGYKYLGGDPSNPKSWGKL